MTYLKQLNFNNPETNMNIAKIHYLKLHRILYFGTVVYDKKLMTHFCSEKIKGFSNVSIQVLIILSFRSWDQCIPHHNSFKKNQYDWYYPVVTYPARNFQKTRVIRALSYGRSWLRVNLEIFHQYGDIGFAPKLVLWQLIVLPGAPFLLGKQSGHAETVSINNGFIGFFLIY